MDQISIRQGTIEEVVELSQMIPEFNDPHQASEYEKRLSGKDKLILIAEVNGEKAGFKVGYNKNESTDFYSWMGAVVPSFRRLGIASMLADYQENYARDKGYQTVSVKTRNKHQNMLLFAIKSEFHIIEVEAREAVKENRILLRKEL